MATPESELYDLLKELFDNVNANVSSYGGLGLSVIGAFFLFKFVTNRLKKIRARKLRTNPRRHKKKIREILPKIQALRAATKILGLKKKKYRKKTEKTRKS